MRIENIPESGTCCHRIILLFHSRDSMKCYRSTNLEKSKGTFLYSALGIR